ncbi:MAG: Coenzyme F420 hydrogenase/dehydrogenase, beta subunit C-terminal domain [Methanospirillum sp.]|nr:Coenzyme F420 hydrogenase/dehydrogenase, beta subunit C-terminal domain [Methanospirillum sp.]
MNGRMLYGWSVDDHIRENAASGGLVTGLLLSLLSSGTVDAVCALRKGDDLYDPRPVLITDPEEIPGCAGSLFCGSVLTADWAYSAVEANPGIKLAVVVKGCDAKAIYELIKRNKLDRDDLFLIGLNCSGTFSPVQTRSFIREVCDMNPDLVDSFQIRDGRVVVISGDITREYPLENIEERGFGRRDSCRRCDTPIPRQCDVVCGTWGLYGEDSEHATFVETCTDKGLNFLLQAEKDGYIILVPADAKGVKARTRVEAAMLTISERNRKAMFAKTGTGMERLTWIMEETSRCIKCYQCSHACPLCICKECQTKKPWLVKPGEVPPPLMFHLIRFSHIADSCINCGQCQDRCAMDIPVSLMMHALQAELEQMFGYHPGKPEGMPVLAKVSQHEEWEHYYENSYQKMIHLFSQKITAAERQRRN